MGLLDYSLLKIQVKAALEELQPIIVKESPKKRGTIKIIRLLNVGQEEGPATGKQWKILSGGIVHLTGTRTEIDFENIDTGALFFVFIIQAAAASDNYPLELQSSEVIIDSADRITFFSGDANALCDLKVLESDVE